MARQNIKEFGGTTHDAAHGPVLQSPIIQILILIETFLPVCFLKSEK